MKDMADIVLKKVIKDYRSSEAYKTLRTNIEFSGADKKVIVFTSCIPNEGKSTVTMGLAEALAEGEKRVLFIDADLRKSVLVGRYKVTGKIKGLTHFLSGQSDAKDVIQKTQDSNLHMIFAGAIPPNPAELLNSRRFQALLASARKLYDYVIIDAPPLVSAFLCSRSGQDLWQFHRGKKTGTRIENFYTLCDCKRRSHVWIGIDDGTF